MTRTPIDTVRKHGSTKVGTRNEALQLVAEAGRHGYTFRQVQQFGGFLVMDITS